MGHETDTTLPDYVADLRAPTPSAAAELAVFDLNAMLQSLEESRVALQRLFTRRLERDKQRCLFLAMRLQKVGPKQRLISQKQRLQEVRTKLAFSSREVMNRYKARLALLAEKMDGASPLKKMGQGYGFISDTKGKAKRSVKELSVGETVKLYLADGAAETTVKKRIIYGDEH